ncbi:FAD-dependent oxidoreductase [Photobacterium minamisatsumaniensis]|uniref:FAD-dependent oxidoreductase n=1 Tax=Photobacterium minamisatsumaniensis TaxID=2910233 RepID=UPI003D0D05AB
MKHYDEREIKNAQLPECSEVVVVGAGMAGLYTSWRILKETNCEDLVIIDGANRTGGRLDSDLITFSDGSTVKEEEGGMRFTFDYMDNLMALFSKLDITDDIVPFPMNSNGNNRRYFRGESFNVNQSSENDYAVWSDLYNLSPSEKNIEPNEMIKTVYNRILAANPDFTNQWDTDDLTPEYWQAFRLDCKWDGTALYNWSLWDLFMAMDYSNESVTLLYRLTGFNGTFLSRMNAGEAFQLLLDFPNDPQFKTLKKGFSTLPNALVESIGKDKIHLRTRLENIEINDKKSKMKYTLTYKGTTPAGLVSESKIETNKVILALPRLALEKLFVKSNAYNRLHEQQASELWNTLQSSTNQPLLKINLYYDKAWWTEDQTAQPTVEFGPNFSDLPTGSVYPFYSLDDELSAALAASQSSHNGEMVLSDSEKERINQVNEEKYDKPAALTIYCDYLNINFWSALQNTGEKFSSEMQQEANFTFPQTIFPASKAVVKQATTFFKQIFNSSYVPKPVFTSARIWQGSTQFDVKASEQFGYGVHQWGLGANDREVIETMIQPFGEDIQVYTCNEAYSDYQGWVEGSLRSSNVMLNRAFGLEPYATVFKNQNGNSANNVVKGKYDENMDNLIRMYITGENESEAIFTEELTLS